ELQYRTQKTTIFITHDLDEALNIGDRIILLKDGEIVQDGTPEEILTSPADDYVAKFIEGVDKTRVLTASSAMRPVRATARPNDGPRNTARRMRESELDVMFVLERDRTLVGLISAQQLKRALRDDAGSIVDYLDREASTIDPDKPLKDRKSTRLNSS